MEDQKMKTAWLTYSWKDNEGTAQGDVDFVIQEIEKHGVCIRSDKRDLIVGKTLWPQIEAHITDEALCDAWVFLVTANSLSSKPCREELLYALDRALDKRKVEFPIVGIFMGQFPANLPKALSVRLCVSTDEPNWAARVAGGIRSKKVVTRIEELPPYHAHLCGRGDSDCIFEVRPRLEFWTPFCFGVASRNAHRVLYAHYAPSTGDHPPNCDEGHRSGGSWCLLPSWEEDGWTWQGVTSPDVSPSMAAHIRFSLGGRPITIRFGCKGGPVFEENLQP